MRRKETMARIRKIEIANFRGIQSLAWQPAPGINCLIGPGDSGKSTVLDAIDFCLGATRNIQFSDADFFNLDVKHARLQLCILLHMSFSHRHTVSYFILENTS